MYLRLSPYREVLQGVLTSLQVNEGIIKITGKSGTGKTALCSQLFHDIERNGQPAVFFLKPPASATALQNEILENLQLDPAGNFTRTLTTYLLARPAERMPLVLIVDDAHQLDAQTFGAIRMLCNIQDKSRALVRVILCGTDVLDSRLESPALRAVTQFVNQSFTLAFLTQEQVKDFCQAYWQTMQEDTRPFSERSLQKLFNETRGQPGILQARLNQGTTGAERSENQLGADTAVLARPPYKYAGSRPGWVSGILILAGLLLLGGAGAWYLSLPDATQPRSVATEPVPEAPPFVPTAIVDAPDSTAPPEEVSVVAVAPEPAPAPAPTIADASADTSVVIEPEARPAVEDIDAPIPEPVAPALPSIESFVTSWTSSWQSQEVDAYLAHYDAMFVPAQGATQEEWRAQRRRVIENATNIMISFDPPEVVNETAEGARVVRFTLNYSAANYADRTVKELLLVPVDGTWRIRTETNLSTERL